MDPIAAALARLSEAQAKSADELEQLSSYHATSSAWTIGGGIAAVVRLCYDPAAADDATAALCNLSNTDDANKRRMREAGAVPALVALLSGGPESEAAGRAALLLSHLARGKASLVAITEVGTIPLLVGLLSGGPESEAVRRVALALANLTGPTGNDADRAVIIEAGAIPLLVALLSGGPEAEAADTAEHAAAALGNLASSEANRDAITGAGAIPPLVALLSGGPESESAKKAAATLGNLAYDSKASKAAIIGAGAIPPLVALLSGGPLLPSTRYAAGALSNLASNDANRAAIIGAGAIAPLVALLNGGTEARVAKEAAVALRHLAHGAASVAVLEEVARTQTDISSLATLRDRLRRRASTRLQAAEGGTDVAALEHAITLATAVQVDAAALARTRERLREIGGDAERQERRESFGLGSLELPDEFVCPITMDKMRGVPPPPSPPARIARAPPPHLPRSRRRPSGGVRRPLIRAVCHPFGAPRRQRLEPAHPRAAPGDSLPKPCPEAAHAGARGGHAACGGHRCSER